MAWDPAVLRKYNTTGHFRLLNQVRSELKGNPLIRPKDGETVGAANRSRSLTRALVNRASAGYGRSRSSQNAQEVVVVSGEPWRQDGLGLTSEAGENLDSDSGSGGFLTRLSSIDLR